MNKQSFLITLFLLLFSFFAFSQSFPERLSAAAIELTSQTVYYDGAYVVIDYPGGDVAPDRGVCTDVVVRAFRKVDIDLQKEVHEDMTKHFSDYPNRWGLSKPDRNIDHRRVPNLMTYFKRQGKAVPVSQKSEDYLPGDVVCWDLGGGVLHIGIVVNKKSKDGKRPMIVHNIGGGQNLEDFLFNCTIIGHYRYR